MMDRYEDPLDGLFTGGVAPQGQDEKSAQTQSDIYDALPGAAYEMLPPVIAKRAYDAASPYWKKPLGEQTTGEHVDAGLNAAGLVPGGKIAAGLGKAMFVGLPAIGRMTMKGSNLSDFLGSEQSLETAKDIWNQMPNAPALERAKASWEKTGWAPGDTYGRTHGPKGFATAGHYSDGDKWKTENPFTWMANAGNHPIEDAIDVDVGVSPWSDVFSNRHNFDFEPYLKYADTHTAMGPNVNIGGSTKPTPYSKIRYPETSHLSVYANDLEGMKRIGDHEAQHVLQLGQGIATPNVNAIDLMAPGSSQAMHAAQQLADEGAKGWGSDMFNRIQRFTNYTNSPWEKMARESSLRHSGLPDDLAWQSNLVPGVDVDTFSHGAFKPFTQSDTFNLPMSSFRLDIDPATGRYLDWKP